MLLLHGKDVHHWIHHKVVQEFRSLPIWQAGVNQRQSGAGVSQLARLASWGQPAAQLLQTPTRVYS